jgi:hypothetical protein
MPGKQKEVKAFTISYSDTFYFPKRNAILAKINEKNGDFFHKFFVASA